MAHFKCLNCRVRIWHDGAPPEHAHHLCPGCGEPLEAVTRAEEIIGLRAIHARPRAGRSIADEIRETIARNDAARIRRLRAKHDHDRPG
jgi:transcription initiation factor IIE alpha subunit